MNATRRAPLILLPLLAILAGCASGAAPLPATSNAPAASAPAGSSAAGPVTSAAEAAAAVLQSDPRFAGLSPFDPNRIGQCCFYRVQGTDTGWTVTIEVGWGDCPSGCIDRHRWAFAVTPAGDVTLMGEDGPPVPAGVPGAGSSGGGAPGASAGSGAGGAGITIRMGIQGVALGGPTCPVTKPNDPACADRAVVGAAIHVVAADGVEVATLETDANGRFTVELEPGRYRVVGDEVEGYMHGPEPVTVTVSTRPVEVSLAYDTGIR